MRYQRHGGKLVFEVELPGKSLQANANGKHRHWALVNKARQAQKFEAKIAAMEAMGARKPPMWEAARAIARFHFKVKRRHDGDNLLYSLKGVWDGLEQAGVVVNDDVITYLPCQVHIDPRPRVQIEIWQYVDIDPTEVPRDD